MREAIIIYEEKFSKERNKLLSKGEIPGKYEKLQIMPGHQRNALLSSWNIIPFLLQDVFVDCCIHFVKLGVLFVQVICLVLWKEYHSRELSSNSTIETEYHRSELSSNLTIKTEYHSSRLSSNSNIKTEYHNRGLSSNPTIKTEYHRRGLSCNPTIKTEYHGRRLSPDLTIEIEYHSRVLDFEKIGCLYKQFHILLKKMLRKLLKSQKII